MNSNYYYFSKKYNFDRVYENPRWNNFGEFMAELNTKPQILYIDKFSVVINLRKLKGILWGKSLKIQWFSV